MTTSTASAPEISPTFSVVEAARKAAGAKTQATWNAKVAAGDVDPDAWKIKMAATRAANKARREAEVAALAAEREQAIADAPVRRARLAVERARKFDKAAAHRAQVEAQMERLNEMKLAVSVVNAMRLTAPGTRGRKALMVTRDNAASIIARGRKAGVVA